MKLTLQRDLTIQDSDDDTFTLKKGDVVEYAEEPGETFGTRFDAWRDGGRVSSNDESVDFMYLKAAGLRELIDASTGPAFVPGDLVQLVSGGPKMTVSGVRAPDPATTHVDCVWFEQARGGLWDIGLIGAGSGSTLMRNAFDARMLKRAT